MKRQPKTVERYETSAGADVKTIREWKEAEISYLLTPGDSPDSLTPIQLRDEILDHADELIDILQVPDSVGRPKGAKDKAPRKKPSQPAPASDLDNQPKEATQ